MAYIILLLYAALVFLTIKTKQTYTPAGIMVLMWAALNGVLLLFFRDMVEIQFSGFYYILLGVGVFLGGAILGQKTSKKLVEKRLLRFNRSLITPVLSILILMAFVDPIYNIYALGFSVSDIFDLESLSKMIAAFCHNRYFEDEQVGYSKVIQLFLAVTYAAPAIGGFCFLPSKKVYQKILCILTALPCIMITVTSAAKMATISALMLWISGILTTILSYNIKVKFSWKTIIAISGTFFVVLVGLFFSLVSRWGKSADSKAIEQTKMTFFDYALGSLMCFDNWFSAELDDLDYSTVLLQHSHLSRFGYFRKVENGVRVEFDSLRSSPSMEVYGRQLYNCEYFAGKDYTVSFNVTSNVKPDSVKYSIFSNTTMPKGHYHIMMDSCRQIGLHTWHYTQSFNLDSNRLLVLTPDIILSLDSVRYLEITKLRIDTGTVEMPWKHKGSNIFWHQDGHTYGVMTFFGIANALGLAERQPGVYRDFEYFGRLNKNMWTNVYTIFRQLIDDFGMVGALVFLFIIGFISSKAIVFIAKRKWIFVCQAFLVAVYSYVMWGFVTSFWAYTTNICCYAFCLIIFVLLQEPLHSGSFLARLTGTSSNK